MSLFRLTILSDIHYAGTAEQGRRGFEHRAVDDPFTRWLLRLYRKFIWLEDPTAHGHLLDEFFERAGEPDFVVANGDYSCDSAFIGTADDAACASASECLGKLRARFGDKFAATIGDHELGKTSLAGNKGGMRLTSWHRTVNELQLQPAWRHDFGRYTLIGVTSTLLGLPVYDRDMLPEEIAEWKKLRTEHLVEVRQLFQSVAPQQKILFFCHDPTALPFLWEEEVVRSRLSQIEA
ncbi:MAG: metallophosphoesterase, partial [Verrucomicrobia bacterium]|nr:metallophosphoesterase [Verrucomicrobiota bacterium]